MERLLAEIAKVLDSGILSGFKAKPEGHLGGRKVRELEDAFCDYFNVKYAVAMNSATSCLHSALIACGVKSGDEVITTPYTFSASASCIVMAGAIPIFADISESNLNIHERIMKNKTLVRRAKAIIVVHLHGCPAEITEILKFRDENNPSLKIIEDCSQAMGAKYGRYPVGTVGDCGIFSFNQFKPISSGEGGMLITNDDEIACIARLVRNHGETQSMILGYNYRMTEITATIALERFKQLDRQNQHRIKLAEHLTQRIRASLFGRVGGLTSPYPIVIPEHVYYTYPLRVNKYILGISRDELQEELLKRGIYFGQGGLKPLHLFPFYGGHEGQFPMAEEAWREIMFTDILKPPMGLKDVDKIYETIKEVIIG